MGMIFLLVISCLVFAAFLLSSQAQGMDSMLSVSLALLMAHAFVETLAKILPKASQASASGGSAPAGKGVGKFGKPVSKQLLKVPKASQLQPKIAIKQTRPQRAPSEAPITVVVYKYSDNARLLIENWPNVVLWEIILQHLCRPSVTFNILLNFPDYLRRANLAEGVLPQTLRELDTNFNMRIVIKPRADPQQIFDATCVAFYVAGTEADAKNAINILDSFFVDRHAHPQPGEVFEQPFQVDYYMHSNAQFDLVATEMDTASVVHEPSAQLPIPFTAGGPPAGARHLLATIDCEDSSAQLLLHGNTWPFRNTLNSRQIPGDYGEEDADGRREYYRVLTVADTNDQATIRVLTDALQAGVGNTIIRVDARTKPTADTPSATFMQELLTIKQLQFT